MPVDNRNFIIQDLPDDPEEDNMILPEDEEDDIDETPGKMNQNTNTTSYQQPQAPWQQATQQVYPWRTPAYQSNPWSTTPFGYRPTPPLPSSTPSWQPQQQQNKVRIPRKKKIIFCDLLDILIESESASMETQQNFRRTGIMPRGLFDIRLKTEVWGKLVAFGADYVFCLTNQAEKSSEDMKTWKVMTDFVMYALADYLNLPHDNCRCFTKIGFSRDSDDVKPGTGLLKKALMSLPKNYRYTRNNMVILGVNSGLQNQADIDKRMASRANIDYIDVSELLSFYY